MFGGRLDLQLMIYSLIFTIPEPTKIFAHSCQDENGNAVVAAHNMTEAPIKVVIKLWAKTFDYFIHLFDERPNDLRSPSRQLKLKLSEERRFRPHWPWPRGDASTLLLLWHRANRPAKRRSCLTKEIVSESLHSLTDRGLYQFGKIRGGSRRCER
jgi:hypothetical protein